MEKNINAKEHHLKLITRKQACELLGMAHPTFFRYYAKGLTTYKNGNNHKDQRHFFDEKEVLALHNERQNKKTGVPTEVVVIRKK